MASKRKVKVPPEALAWGNLAATALAIYTPRVIAYLAKRRRDPAATPAGDVIVLTRLPGQAKGAGPN